MPDLHETRMGHKFFEGDIPNLIKQHEELNKEVAEIKEAIKELNFTLNNLVEAVKYLRQGLKAPSPSWGQKGADFMSDCWFEDVDICPHCDTENDFLISEEKLTYTGICNGCNRQIFLCDLCFHSDDNLSQKCDWHMEGDDSVCMRGRISPKKV